MDALPTSGIPQEPWLAHLLVHLPVAREGRDPEGVHQVRVAAARLDTWLWLGERPALRDGLRRFRRHAGRLRDLDVLLDAAPPAAWRPWLTARRDVERARFLTSLDDPGLAVLLDGLRALPVLARDLAGRRTALLRSRVADRGRRLEEDPRDLERCHDLRKAVRRLRYALEWCGETTRPIRAMQKVLGNLNDAAVALALTEEWEEHDRIEDYRCGLRARLEEMRGAAVEAWCASRIGA